MLDNERFVNCRKIFDLAALARVHQKSRALDFSGAVSVNFAEHRDQCDGQVIDAKKSQILESVENRSFAGAGKAGENYELPGIPYFRRTVSSEAGALHGVRRA